MDIKPIHKQHNVEVKFEKKKFSYDAIYLKIDDSTIKSHVPKNAYTS